MPGPLPEMWQATVRPSVSKIQTKKSFFSLMNGDIAHCSIRSSMSRIAEARLPRMISSVTGSSAGVALVTGSGTRTLQHDVLRVVDARATSRGDQRRGVVLVHERGAVEARAGAESIPVVARRHHDARAPEVDAALAGPRVTGVAVATRHGLRRALGEDTDRGDPEIHELDRRAGEVVRVEPAVLGVEGLEQRRKARGAQRSVCGGAGELEALVLVAQIGRPFEALPVARNL